MEKLAASLGDKMTGSCPETLKKIPGMEVIDLFLTLTKSHKEIDLKIKKINQLFSKRILTSSS